MEVLGKEDVIWVEQMLAIQGLSSYSDAEVIAKIKGMITSSNWYVRTNAAEYLKNNGLDKASVKEIVALNDRYV
jgi:HEAT repeat protein